MVRFDLLHLDEVLELFKCVQSANKYTLVGRSNQREPLQPIGGESLLLSEEVSVFCALNAITFDHLCSINY